MNTEEIKTIPASKIQDALNATNTSIKELEKELELLKRDRAAYEWVLGK